MFNKISANKELPDDIYLLKEIRGKENRIYYAPSIILHDGDRGGMEEGELEDAVALRAVNVENKGMVDIVVRNNSYMPVRSRKVRVYYAAQEEAEESCNWKALKTPLGQSHTEVGMVLPCQDGLGRESFLMPDEKNGPYYLIAALDEEFNETDIKQEKVDLNQLNESYYWCILDSEEMMESI